MALRLFASLYHHLLLPADDANDDDDHDNDDDDDGEEEVTLLINGMFLHIVDALAKSLNVEHVVVVDALPRRQPTHSMESELQGQRECNSTYSMGRKQQRRECKQTM